eukprot:TRINITY_DN3682_c3_g1_i1.p1 TRINITY_DN3682_c3_g1~~TRINITY_DN3682_c3_g1_i1.p1  ORF type:complete len:617 (+),score=114.67 TRINITY_DN3682_c3_g1_i1:58-1908(+)
MLQPAPDKNREFEKLRRHYAEERAKRRLNQANVRETRSATSRRRELTEADSKGVLITTRSLPRAMKVFGLSSVAHKENEGRNHARTLSAKILQRRSNNSLLYAKVTMPRRMAINAPQEVILDSSTHRDIQTDATSNPANDQLLPTAAENTSPELETSPLETPLFVPHVPTTNHMNRAAENRVRGQLRSLINTSSERMKSSRFDADGRSKAKDTFDPIFGLTTIHTNAANGTSQPSSPDVNLVGQAAGDLDTEATAKNVPEVVEVRASDLILSADDVNVKTDAKAGDRLSPRTHQHSEFMQQLQEEKCGFLRESSASLKKYNMQRHQVYGIKQHTLKSQLRKSWEEALKNMTRIVDSELEKQNAAERREAQLLLYNTFEENVQNKFGSMITAGTRQILDELKNCFADETLQTDKRFEATINLLTGSRYLLHDCVSVLYSVKHLFKVSEQQFIDHLKVSMKGLFENWDSAMQHKVLPSSEDGNALQWVMQLPPAYVGPGVITWVLMDTPLQKSENQCLEWLKTLSANASSAKTVAVALESSDPSLIPRAIVDWVLSQSICDPVKSLLSEEWINRCKLSSRDSSKKGLVSRLRSSTTLKVPKRARSRTTLHPFDFASRV